MAGEVHTRCWVGRFWGSLSLALKWNERVLASVFGYGLVLPNSARPETPRDDGKVAAVFGHVAVNARNEGLRNSAFLAARSLEESRTLVKETRREIGWRMSKGLGCLRSQFFLLFFLEI